MAVCSPVNCGCVPLLECNCCDDLPGRTEYKDNYKKWCNYEYDICPNSKRLGSSRVNNYFYPSYFGCSCGPGPSDCRFLTTYQNYYDYKRFDVCGANRNKHISPYVSLDPHLRDKWERGVTLKHSYEDYFCPISLRKKFDCACRTRC